LQQWLIARQYPRPVRGRISNEFATSRAGTLNCVYAFEATVRIFSAFRKGGRSQCPDARVVTIFWPRFTRIQQALFGSNYKSLETCVLSTTRSGAYPEWGNRIGSIRMRAIARRTFARFECGCIGLGAGRSQGKRVNAIYCPRRDRSDPRRDRVHRRRRPSGPGDRELSDRRAVHRRRGQRRRKILGADAFR